MRNVIAIIKVKDGAKVDARSAKLHQSILHVNAHTKALGHVVAL